MIEDVPQMNAQFKPASKTPNYMKCFIDLREMKNFLGISSAEQLANWWESTPPLHPLCVQTKTSCLKGNKRIQESRFQQACDEDVILKGHAL